VIAKGRQWADESKLADLAVQDGSFLTVHFVLQLKGGGSFEKVHAVVARSTFRSQKCKKLRGTGHFWTFRCRFAWQAQGIVHLVKSEQNVRVL